jgi:hypothetical protein
MKKNLPALDFFPMLVTFLGHLVRLDLIVLITFYAFINFIDSFERYLHV